MDKLIKQVSLIGIISQLIWSLLLFSSFDVEQVQNAPAGWGSYLIGALAFASTIGWLILVAILFINEEIESKMLWFFALLFLPGQFIFWIKYVLEAESIETMEPSFDRETFLEKYDVEPNRSEGQPVQPAHRPRALTPPVFMKLPSRKANRNQSPRQV